MMTRERWPSRAMFVFAAIGSSVGLGNIWRFPFLVGKYGGGAFLFPYLLLMVIFGIPLLILEFALGQKMQHGAIRAFRKVKEKFSGIGLGAVLCSYGVSCYYAVVIAWSLLYLFFSFNLSWDNDPKSFFFENVLQASKGPWEIGNIATPVLGALVITWLIIYFCVWKGVKSVSAVVTFTMPLPVLLLIILLGRTLFLPGASDGLTYFLTPNFQALLDFDVWMAAMTQIFFSLTIGFGVMITYGSYQHTNSDIVKNAFITGLADAGIAILAGLVVFTTLGNMAEASGQSVADLAASGPSLAFIVFPKALTFIPGAPLFAILFFLTLITLGIDSLFSLVEAVVSIFADRWPHLRKQDLVLYTCVICFIGGIVFTTAGGIYYLDISDHFLTSYGLVSVTLMEAIAIGWFYGSDRLRIWINEVSDHHIGKWWNGSIQYLAPLCLTTLILSKLYIDITRPYEGYPLSALLIMGWGGVGLILLVSIGYSFRKSWSVTGSNR